MNSNHLTEEQIQQYAMEPSTCGEEIKQHVDTCGYCQSQAAVYLQLFAAIKEQPQPSFDMDLSSLVLPQLSPVPRKSTDGLLLIFGLLVLASLFILGYVFRNIFPNIFNGIIPIMGYLMCITVLIVVGFQCIDIFSKYQKQLNALN
jgi:hypothetical protein